MSEQHLPEPWRLKRTAADRVIAGEPAEPFTVANCWSGPFAPERHVAHANARRIVAAINALTGVSTEVLESLEPGTLADLVAGWLAAKEG